MKISSKGTGTRYDNYSEGDYVQIKSYYLNFKQKKCSKCKEMKIKKGGTNPVKNPWFCADCKN